MKPDFNLIICIPTFNDWEAISILAVRLDQVLASLSIKAHLLLIDDGSTLPAPDDLLSFTKAFQNIEILELRRNLGHQRALAIGLSFIYDQRAADAILVMDGDGEDAPESIPELLEEYKKHNEQCIVFAQRARRPEGIVFKLGYQAFKIAHWLLTGLPIKVGNFSMIPHKLLGRIVGVSELWNHYAASVLKSRIPYQMIPIDRKKRIAGQSKMNLTSLILHGLSAISVYADSIGIRFLVGTFVLSLFTIIGLSTLVGAYIITDTTLPQWAILSAGFLVVILLQSFLISLIFVFAILQGRHGATFLPIRDYPHFVYTVHALKTPG